ncbi:MAG TPA: serine hydrolase [Bryobacteraceae bacterium]|nr:serine hydrolase [Bryobacteraceae bacterium]
MRIIALVLFLVHILLAQPNALDGFDSYATRSLKDFDVPGIAVAVVKDGQVVLAKGYGVRKLGDPARVDENTLFGIASISKAFTAASIAMLVDEGKLKWDDRVIDHMPSFQLSDPYATREMTVRDLLCHRSGLPAYGGDLLSFAYDRPRGEILRRLRYLKPATSFRDRYAYQNNMFLAAGELIPLVTGKSWDDFIAERIFNKLGMTSSSTSFTALASHSNKVTPHARIPLNTGALRPVVWQKVDGIGPAASINSNVKDMAQWIKAQLAGGEYPGGRLFSEAAQRQMWSPQMVLPAGGPPSGKTPRSKFSAYGLGWSISEYRGRKVLSHGGALTGMFSRLMLVPEEKIGVVVLTNSETAIGPALAYRAVDAFLGGPAEDWTAAYVEQARQAEKRATERVGKQEAERNKTSKPSLALPAYAGTYDCDLVGPARIAPMGASLHIVLDPSDAGTGEAEHWQYNTFLIRWKDPTVVKAFLTFQLAPDGKVLGFRMEQAEEGDPSFDFENLEYVKRTPTSARGF